VSLVVRFDPVARLVCARRLPLTNLGLRFEERSELAPVERRTLDRVSERVADELAPTRLLNPRPCHVSSSSSDETVVDRPRTTQFKWSGRDSPDMADHHDHDHYKEFDDERVTSPMQAFTGSEVGTGAVVALVGLLVTFGIPLLLVA
jgi:hypothetical protein